MAAAIAAQTANSAVVPVNQAATDPANNTKSAGPARHKRHNGATIAAATFTLLVLLPTDALLDRRRLVLSQVVASADYEQQNVCSQLDFLRQRRDAAKKQLKLMQQDNNSPAQPISQPILQPIPQLEPQPEPQPKTVQPETHT